MDIDTTRSSSVFKSLSYLGKFIGGKGVGGASERAGPQDNRVKTGKLKIIFDFNFIFTSFNICPSAPTLA